MKKITLIISLMTLSLGYSQSLPLNFSAANQLMTGDGCATSLTTDAGDPVMQVVGGGGLYDNAQINFAQNLSLADDANNTITFRIKPVNGTGSGSHLLKFETGVAGPATTELPFTTTGTAWQNITINFGAGLGNFGKMVIFTDFNNGSIDTYLIDDIAGGTNVAGPTPVATPPTFAPVPTIAAANVISMFGETYTNTFQYQFGASTTIDLDGSAAVNNALKINLAQAGFGAGYTTTNVSSMTHVHFDYWTPDATAFGFYLISTATGEKIYSLPASQPVVQNTWVSVNIPLTYFTGIGFDPTTWFQYKFDVAPATPGTIYIDNVYFTNAALSTSQFDNSKIRMYPNPTSSNLTFENTDAIDTITIYNTLGQEVMRKSTSSSVETISVSDLQSGVYIVKVSSAGNTSRQRFVKK